MPFYYLPDGQAPDARIDRIFQTVAEVGDRVERDSGVKITGHARLLTVNTLSAVIQDPSPSWRANEANRDFRLNGLMEGLPRTMRDLTRAADASRQVTYFDALHWLGSRLDKLCPFEK